MVAGGTSGDPSGTVGIVHFSVLEEVIMWVFISAFAGFVQPLKQ